MCNNVCVDCSLFPIYLLNSRLTDLLVGAPMFMMHDSDGRLEELGRVYVYLQMGPLELASHLPHLTGTQIFSRFGSSITPLGDLNQDGFNGEYQSINSICFYLFVCFFPSSYSYINMEFLYTPFTLLLLLLYFFALVHLICNKFFTPNPLDIAISSPFGGKDEQGLVFIYNGYTKGLREKPSQVISGQWSSAAPLATPAGFGYTMKGGKDLDYNGYTGMCCINHHVLHLFYGDVNTNDANIFWKLLSFPFHFNLDLIVGAFGADKAVLYRLSCQLSCFVESY